MLMVQKYGGTSLADGERMLAAARRTAALVRQGHSVVLVVSAQGDTTDRLVSQAQACNRRGAPREMDALLATGEQACAALMAMTLGSLGVKAVSLTGAQAGLVTDGNYGNAQILALRPERVRKELAGGNVVVVAGFQGADSMGNITTLGRGGSDTTAVALAAALGADKCQIYTDVSGVYDRDPRRFADAVRFDRIGYEKMLDLIAQGAQVLHHRSVQLARETGISIEVLSAFTEAPGTVVGTV